MLPRRFPSNSKRAEHTFSCNLESKRVPVLLGYFTVAKLYGQVPSDPSLIGVQTCRYTSFTHALIYVDAASWGLNGCEFTPARNYVDKYHLQLGKWCTGQSAPTSCTRFLTGLKCRFYSLLGVCSGKFLNRRKTLIFPLYVIFLLS